MFKRPIVYSVLHTIKNHKLLTFALVLTIIGSVAFAVIPPLVLEKIIFEMTENGTMHLYFALYYFAFLALSGITDALRGGLIASFGQKTTAKLRGLMAEKLALLPQSYFITNEAGKILSRFTMDIDTIDTLFKSGVISMIVDLFKIVFILIAVFTKSLGLGIMLLVATPVVFAISWHFKKAMHSAQMDNRRAIAKINNHIPETLANNRTIHTLTKEEYMKKRFRRYVDESYFAFRRTYFYEAIYTPIICEISVLIVAMLMVFSASSGAMQTFFGMHVSTAVAVLSFVSKIFNPIENLGMEIQNMQSAFAGARRIGEFFEESEKQPQPITSLAELDFEKPAIAFENVTFAYDEKVILNNVSFSINMGDSIAFVGRTGAGKTTVFRLVLGLFSPQSGSVKIFGVQSDKISDQIKRNLFGYAEQNIRLVLGTVREQITLGDESITDDDVITALKIVDLYNKVESFANGLNQTATPNMFSQGEMQLLSIARAIVAKPKILLLDEITAHLDSATEKRTQNAIINASKSRTVLNISHRLGDIIENTRIIDITKLNENKD